MKVRLVLTPWLTSLRLLLQNHAHIGPDRNNKCGGRFFFYLVQNVTYVWAFFHHSDSFLDSSFSEGETCKAKICVNITRLRSNTYIYIYISSSSFFIFLLLYLYENPKTRHMLARKRRKVCKYLHLRASYDSINIYATEVLFCFESDLLGAQQCLFSLYQWRQKKTDSWRDRHTRVLHVSAFFVTSQTQTASSKMTVLLRLVSSLTPTLPLPTRDVSSTGVPFNTHAATANPWCFFDWCPL